ncbi:hypothetical protein [Janthinobacterium sp. PSPC3-1]|uniref:hypothetical protein n=1 Tax=Janthinobacterium sp. PSPC3-1 TaxID=2804653 RepID=UPI003CEDD12D
MMPALPPLQLSASSGANADAKGGYQGSGGGISSGDWNVNQGSGDQGMTSKTWMMVAAAGAVAFLLFKKKH